MFTDVAVRALSECVVLLLNRDVFEKAIMSNPDVREAVIKLALKRKQNTAELRAQYSHANLI